MTEVLFYHLEQRPLDAVIPVLLQKTLERGWKAVVEIGSQERAEALDATLWTWHDESFLPHGLAGTEFDADQPILLTTETDNPNSAEVRFFVDRAIPHDPDDYDRLVYLFDGHDPDAVTEARTVWKKLSVDHEVTYWQQENSGRWVKKG